MLQDLLRKILQSLAEKSSAEKYCKKQMRSNMNSQSSMHRLGNCCKIRQRKVRPRKVAKNRQKRLENISKFEPEPSPKDQLKTSTLKWEAAVHQEHVVCSSLRWGCFTANDHRDHVVHAVVLTSMGSDSDKI